MSPRENGDPPKQPDREPLEGAGGDQFPKEPNHDSYSAPYLAKSAAERIARAEAFYRSWTRSDLLKKATALELRNVSSLDREQIIRLIVRAEQPKG